nr:MAG TPA: hypothetical protein [Caudoviricetes sp.]
MKRNPHRFVCVNTQCFAHQGTLIWQVNLHLKI